MATLTPGVLLKLLQFMNSDSKPLGEHRSAVLQVTGIVPAPSSTPSSDDLWPSHGFYLQLSDSIHSTYVSLSDHDADLVVSNRPQLGQLVHLDRLNFDLPVPRATGLRPISSPRHHPFIGSPEPLIAISSLSHTSGFVIQSVSPSTAASTVKPRTVLAPKENFFTATSTQPSSGSTSTSSVSKPKRRFSSPALRNPSPSSEKHGSRGRAPSPVPSKCEVPSLVAAKEENRSRVSREPSIIVPSRYRQPSPVGRKAMQSPMGRKGSGSPGVRRLSTGLKISPALGESSGRRKGSLVSAGISRVSDALSGSRRSVRKSWEENSSSSEASSVDIRERKGSKRQEQVPMKTQVSDAISHNKAHNVEEESTDEKPSTSVKIAASIGEIPNHMEQKVSVYDPKWTDGSIPLDNVSQKLARLGKEAFERRNIASKAAAEALEEALATESIIRSLSMFSDLCLISKTGNPLRTINAFLSIYDDVVKGISNISTLLARRTENNFADTSSISRAKSASIWVQAALRTDLEVLNLINSISSDMHLKVSEKIAIPCEDFPKACTSKRGPNAPTKSQPKPSSTNCSSPNIWTLELAESLRYEMQLWFLKFVEGAISVGFFLFGDKEASFKDNSKVAAVVFHLKRVSDWIDEVFRKPEDEMLEEKIEQLRQKIYNFVMTHMGLMKPISNSWDVADDDDSLTSTGSAFNRVLSLGKP